MDERQREAEKFAVKLLEAKKDGEPYTEEELKQAIAFARAFLLLLDD